MESCWLPTSRKPSASVHHLNYALLQIQSPLLVLHCQSVRRYAYAVWSSTSIWHSKATSGVVKSCNYHLRALQHIRHLLPFSTAQTLACSLILSRLDYCNAVLYSCSPGAIGRLQRVRNYAERVVTQSNRYMPSQPLLQSLHWLPVQQRLVYKAALITYIVVTLSAPSYLSDLLAVHIPATPSRHSSTRPLLTVPTSHPTSPDDPSALSHQLYGTLCLVMYTVFHKIGTPLCFGNNFFKCWSI